MSVQELSDAEVERRYNHWNDNDTVSHCKGCGSFVNKPTPENGQVRYQCNACESWHLEYVG